ncbi:MAG TPA: hypothetical protein VGY53_01960 [Isosphaeraceae bacterium]|nr:hypothetical protein [Isosphaeraceae bacterium]
MIVGQVQPFIKGGLSLAFTGVGGGAGITTGAGGLRNQVEIATTRATAAFVIINCRSVKRGGKLGSCSAMILSPAKEPIRIP